MKSNATLQLNKAWWKKEAPDDLDKAGTAFEQAIEKYAKANAGLRSPSPRAIAEMEGAIKALEDAGKQVIAKCKDLEKKAKGDKDLVNTRTVMEKVLPKEIAGIKDALLDAQDELDGDAGDGTFANPDEYVKFLKKFAGKLKRAPYSFALAMTSQKPVDMRMNLHKSKGGRALLGQIKKEVGVSKFTFGIAGTEAVSSDLGMEGEGARTLILHVEGKMIPSLAKRTRLMLKQNGISAFGKVKVYRDGVETEADDASSGDDVEEIDLTPDDDIDIEAVTASSTATTTGDSSDSTSEASTSTPSKEVLNRRLAAATKTVAALEDKTQQAKLAKALGQGKALLGKDKLEDADKVITLVEKQLGAVRYTGEKEKPEDVIPFNVVPFNKALLIWAKTREKMLSDIKTLETKIVDVCKDDPELAPIATEARTLSSRLDRFDAELETALEAITTSQTTEERARHKEQASGAIGRYSAVLQEPFFQDVDDNGFVSLTLTASATQALTAIDKTLKENKV